MKKLLLASAAFVFMVGMAHGMGSKPSGSGDKELDTTLEQIRLESDADRDGFLSRLGSRYNMKDSDIRQAMDKFGLGGADIFMATALANATGRSVLDVSERYDRKQGKGWGVIAKDLGIKPGSERFHDLKNGAHGFLDDMKTASASKQKHEQGMKQDREHKESKEKGESAGKGHGGS